MTTFNVKHVACNKEPIENERPTLLFLSALCECFSVI